MDEDPITTVSSNVLLRKGQLIPSVKVLSFYRTRSFKMEAFYANQSELPAGASVKISCYQVNFLSRCKTCLLSFYNCCVHAHIILITYMLYCLFIEISEHHSSSIWFLCVLLQYIA